MKKNRIISKKELIVYLVIGIILALISCYILFKYGGDPAPLYVIILYFVLLLFISFFIVLSFGIIFKLIFRKIRLIKDWASLTFKEKSMILFAIVTMIIVILFSPLWIIIATSGQGNKLFFIIFTSNINFLFSIISGFIFSGGYLLYSTAKSINNKFLKRSLPIIILICFIILFVISLLIHFGVIVWATPTPPYMYGM